jgi:hypothetical protein
MPVQGKAPAPETLGDVPVLRRSVLPLALMSLAATTLLTHQALPPSSTRLASVTTLESAGFDSLPTGRISAKSFNAELGGGYWDEKNYDDSSVQTDTRGTGKVYRLTLQAGTIHDNPSGNNGIVAVIPLAKQVDNACLAYDIRFDPNFDWSLGGKLPGLSGVAPGVAATWPAGGNYGGSKGWSGRMLAPGADVLHDEHPRHRQRQAADLVRRPAGPEHHQPRLPDALRRPHQPHDVVDLPRWLDDGLGGLPDQLHRHRQGHHHHRLTCSAVPGRPPVAQERSSR